MRRRALLATGCTLATAGCLGTIRRQTSGRLSFDHARGRLHAASDAFVRGGIDGRSESPYGAWLFTSAPPREVSVFTDALGDEPRREWDNEVHNEDYDAGFLLLAQVRTRRERATRLSPGPPICDAAWTGLRAARLPLWLKRDDGPEDEIPAGNEVVATLLTYFEAADAPTRASVPFLSERTNDCEAANATLTAEEWSPP